MALRAGCRGLLPEKISVRTLLEAFRMIVESLRGFLEGWGNTLLEVPCMIIGQLRTGADKGNPTV